MKGLLMTEETFFDSSKIIAENFLQTVLFVDESIKFPEDIDKNPLTSPKPRPGTDINISDVPNPEGSQVEQASHNLVINEIIGIFAEKRILCSIIKPERADLSKLPNTLVNLLDNSDISILDWKLGDVAGKEVLDVLEKMNEKRYPGLHLLIIYSAEAPQVILEAICEKLSIGFPTGEDKSLNTRFGRVVIAAKPGNKFTDVHVNFDQLPDFAVNHFTDLVMGLISNSVLQAISIIRKKTNQIIDQFSRNLDPPYLTHRMLLLNPEDAEKHIEKMIVGEFDGLVEGNIGKSLDVSEIKKWLEWKDFPNYTDDTTTITNDQFGELLEIGFEEYKKQSSGKVSNNFHKKNISTHLGGDENSDRVFAYILEAKSKYNDDPPLLTTGTILESGSGNFLLCVQARCDCVRIIKERAFPFLKLNKIESEKDFNLIIKDQDNHYLKIKIDNKPYNIELINFTISGTENKVIAQQDQDKYIFMDSQGTKYYWLGELRFDFAQKIINEYSSEISRVGVNESEWLRRKYESKE